GGGILAAEPRAPSSLPNIQKWWVRTRRTHHSWMLGCWGRRGEVWPRRARALLISPAGRPPGRRPPGAPCPDGPDEPAPAESPHRAGPSPDPTTGPHGRRNAPAARPSHRGTRSARPPWTVPRTPPA